jgi:hypothetical protein
MWKKTIVRTSLIILVATAAGIFVFTTTSSSKKAETPKCTQTNAESCNKNQSDFIIWESLSRAIMTNVQF